MAVAGGRSGERTFRTGLEPLDSDSGGVPAGKLLIVSGEEKSGRTSLILQLCAIAASLGRKCFLIDPGSRMHISRLRAICDAWHADLTKIWISSPRTLREQTKFILRASEVAEAGSLIAVDSITYLYRLELVGDLHLDRPKFMELAFELASLKSVALNKNTLSVVVVDVHDVPATAPSVTRPVAENLLKHFADFSMHLTNVSGDLKSLTYELGPASGTLTVRTTFSGIAPASRHPAVF